MSLLVELIFRQFFLFYYILPFITIYKNIMFKRLNLVMGGIEPPN